MPNYSSGGGGGGGGSTPAPTPASYGYISAGSASGLAFARHAFSNDAAAMVTVGQVFSGTGNFYGQFGCNSDLAGYVFGGTILAPPSSTQNSNSALIVKLLFSSDSILCQRVNSIDYAAGFGAHDGGSTPSRLKGYFVGGRQTSMSSYATSSALTFASDTTAVAAAAMLPAVTDTSGVSAASSENHGYFQWSAGIGRLNFAVDTLAQATTITTGTKQYAGAANSSLNAYFAGGAGPLTSITKMSFNNDSAALTTPNNLPSGRQRVAGYNNANYAYFAGGNTSSGINGPTSNNWRLDFANDTSALVTVASLPSARTAHTAFQSGGFL